MKTTRKGAARATTGKKADPDSLESRMASFAEQVGRLAGTVAGKADGWMDGKAIQQQLAAVRDGAAGLLRHIAGREAASSSTVTKGTRPRSPKMQPAMAGDTGAPRRGRSGGSVDAPGKKHRGPLPADPDATAVASQSAKLRVARPMAKTSRLRGRG